MKGKHHDRKQSKPESDQPATGAASQSFAAAAESTKVGAVSAHQLTDGQFFNVREIVERMVDEAFKPTADAIERRWLELLRG